MTKMSEIISRTTKEETEKLCIEQNPVRDEVRSVPGIGETSLGRPRNKFGIKKDRRLSARSTIRRNLEKHGVKNASALPEVRAKTEKTAMERHGVRASSQSPETKEKQKTDEPEKTRRRIPQIRLGARSPGCRRRKRKGGQTGCIDR